MCTGVKIGSISIAGHSVIADSPLQLAFAAAAGKFRSIFSLKSYTYLIANFIVMKQ